MQLNLTLDLEPYEIVIILVVFGMVVIKLLLLAIDNCSTRQDKDISYHQQCNTPPSCKCHTKQCCVYTPPSKYEYSPEYKAIQEHFCNLTLVLPTVDVKQFAALLYSNNFIGKDMMSRDNPDPHNLILSVHRQVQASPQRFHDFIDILKSESTLDNVRMQLEKSYYSLRLGSEIKEVYIVYTGRLQGEAFNNRCKDYWKAILANDSTQLYKLTRKLERESSIKADELIFFQCYLALGLTHISEPGSNAQARTILIDVLRNIENLKSKNKELLEGRAYRILASAYRKDKQYTEAYDAIQKSRRALQNARRTSEKAYQHLEEAKIIQSDAQLAGSRKHVATVFTQVLVCTRSFDDIPRRNKMLPMVYIHMALFYLNPTPNSGEVTAETWMEFEPTDYELHCAQDCLERLQHASSKELGQGNIYEVRFKTAMSDLYRHQKQNKEAYRLLKEVHNLKLKEGIIDEECLRIKDKLDWLERHTGVVRIRQNLTTVTSSIL